VGCCPLPTVRSHKLTTYITHITAHRMAPQSQGPRYMQLCFAGVLCASAACCLLTHHLLLRQLGWAGQVAQDGHPALQRGNARKRPAQGVTWEAQAGGESCEAKGAVRHQMGCHNGTTVLPSVLPSGR